MAWYKFWASHGPGHQGKTIEYRWFDPPLKTKDARKEAWQEWCDPYWEWPIGNLRLVHRIPKSAHDLLVSRCELGILGARAMLRVLAKTETYVQRVKKYRRLRPKKS